MASSTPDPAPRFEVTPPVGGAHRRRLLLAAGVILAGVAAVLVVFHEPPPAIDVAAAGVEGVTEDAEVVPDLGVATEPEPTPVVPPEPDDRRSVPPPPDAVVASGGLFLQFADEQGNPVPEIAVSLLVPNAPDAVEAVDEAPSTLADAEGVARFDDLAPGVGYRWRADSGGWSLDIRPSHESMLPRPPPADGGRHAPELVTDLSGAFQIEAGVITRFVVTVFRSTGIRGRIAPREEQDGPVQVRIMTRRDNPTTFTDDFPELRVPGPGFAVRGVPPAESKRVLVIWRELGNRFYVAKYDFALAEGESKDLGLIGPWHETVVRGTTAIEIDGAAVDPAELLRAGASGAAMIGFRRMPRLGDSADVVFNDFFDLAIGESFSLHGLPGGEWAIDLQARFEHELAAGVQLDSPSVSSGVQLPGDAECRLALTAVRPVPIRVELVFPPNHPRAPLKLFGVAESGRTTQTTIFPRDEGTVETVIEGTPGRWWIFATSHRFQASGEDDLWGEATIDVTGTDDAARVQLSPGRPLRGTARSTSPSRAPTDRGLSFTLPRFAHLASPPRLFSVKTDDEGRFVLHGVPPGPNPMLLPQPALEVEFDR